MDAVQAVSLAGQRPLGLLAVDGLEVGQHGAEEKEPAEDVFALRNPDY